MSRSQPTNRTVKKPRLLSDNLCKYLAEKYPELFIEWVFGVKVEKVEVLKTELSRDPVRLDSANLLNTDNQIFHLEFQTTAKSHLPLALRMLDYHVSLKRKFLDSEINQAILVLHDNGEEISNKYEAKGLFYSFPIVKLWEVDLDDLSKYKELLPLASLCRIKTNKEDFLKEVASKINEIEDSEERGEILDMAKVFAGLRFPVKMIYEFMRGEGMLEESSVVQDWLRRGRREGLQEGRKEGLQEGEKQLVIRQLTKRFGNLSDRTIKRIENLSLAQIEMLGDALLDFKEKSEITKWLKNVG